MSTLEEPLSKWERFRARYLGAKPQYKVLAKDKKSLWVRAMGAIKYIGAVSAFTPFLPSMIAFALLNMGLGTVSHQSLILLILCDTGALCVGMGLRNLLNIFGLAAGSVVVLMSGVFIAADNVYQNVCQKLFNPNFKDYPLKNMLQNMEALNRRENALRLHNPDLEFELSFCIQQCEPETIKSVWKWCNGTPSLLEYRHLEALRAQVLHQFKSFSSYTQRLNAFQKNKSVRAVRKETEEVLKLYATRDKIQSALTNSPPQITSHRRM